MCIKAFRNPAGYRSNRPEAPSAPRGRSWTFPPSTPPRWASRRGYFSLVTFGAPAEKHRKFPTFGHGNAATTQVLQLEIENDPE
jgi:hypothetical protein